MKVVLFGATGMVGTGVLRECLRDARVREVVAVVRNSSGTTHPKLREQVRQDFYDYSDLRDTFRGADASFLLRLPLKACMLRPGYIQPLGGIRSKTRIYRVFYQVMAPLYPLLRRLTPNLLTTNEAIGRCMIELAVRGHPTPIIEPRDINALGSGTRQFPGSLL